MRDLFDVVLLVCSVGALYGWFVKDTSWMLWAAHGAAYALLARLGVLGVLLTVYLTLKVLRWSEQRRA